MVFYFITTEFLSILKQQYSKIEGERTRGDRNGRPGKALAHCNASNLEVASSPCLAPLLHTAFSPTMLCLMAIGPAASGWSPQM